MTATQIAPIEYSALLGKIRERIRSAQYEALKAVNKELITLYWDIGRMIVERQQGESWGKSVVQRLSGDLQKDFPGIQGFSARNIWYNEYAFDFLELGEEHSERENRKVPTVGNDVLSLEVAI